MTKRKTCKDLRDVADAYNKAAVLYDLMNRAYFFGRDKGFRSMIADRLIQTPKDTVLNLCCGTGLDLPFLIPKTKAGGGRFGVDVSYKMLRQAKKRTGNKVNLVVANAALLPFRDEAFDAVLVSFCLRITLTHEKAVKEDSRVLKRSGRIGILANHKPSGTLGFIGPLLVKVLSPMSKIDFEINLKTHLSTRFAIIEERRIHGGLVQFLVGEKIQ